MEKDSIENNVGSSTDAEKPRFREVCQSCGLDYQAMESIAKKAGLQKLVIDAMSVSKAVKQAHAETILAALSEHTGQTWSLKNVRVALMPTFADFHRIHQFDLDILSITSWCRLQSKRVRELGLNRPLWIPTEVCQIFRRVLPDATLRLGVEPFEDKW